MKQPIYPATVAGREKNHPRDEDEGAVEGKSLDLFVEHIVQFVEDLFWLGKLNGHIRDRNVTRAVSMFPCRRMFIRRGGGRISTFAWTIASLAVRTLRA